VKAVLFDLDGTLLDRDSSLRKFIDDQYERLKGKLGLISKDKYINRFIELDCKGYVWKDKVYQQLIVELNLTEFTSEQLLQDYVERFKYHCVPFPNLIKMLDQLKEDGYILGMITNGRERFQMDNVKALRIEDYFDVILVSESEGIKKPDPQIFHRALEKLTIGPEESVFVGDHPENDVIAAEKIGMTGVWKRDDYWSEENIEFVINDLNEIPQILKVITSGQKVVM
jgi:putative hydrolase of the HAD superfamily